MQPSATGRAVIEDPAGKGPADPSTLATAGQGRDRLPATATSAAAASVAAARPSRATCASSRGPSARTTPWAR